MTNFIKYLIIIFYILFNNVALSQENIYYVDMDSIMNNSLAGKSIIKQLEKENKSFSNSFKKTEENLKKDETKLISQKNMVLICQQHPPGTRTKNHIHELSNWIQNHGPSIFKNLLKKEIIDICQNMIIKTYTANEILFLQGQKGNTFWIIVQGQVKIFVENDKSYEQVKLHNYIDN